MWADININRNKISTYGTKVHSRTLWKWIPMNEYKYCNSVKETMQNFKLLQFSNMLCFQTTNLQWNHPVKMSVSIILHFGRKRNNILNRPQHHPPLVSDDSNDCVYYWSDTIMMPCWSIINVLSCFNSIQKSASLLKLCYLNFQ